MTHAATLDPTDQDALAAAWAWLAMTTDVEPAWLIARARVGDEIEVAGPDAYRPRSVVVLLRRVGGRWLVREVIGEETGSDAFDGARAV